MFTEKALRERNRIDRLRRRHMQFAQAYEEGKRLFRELCYTDSPWISVPFKPVHYYMHVLPGFNQHLIPAKYIGWRRLRAVDVTTDPDKDGFVRVSLNADYLAKRNW